VDRSEELPGGLRAAQVVLGQLTAPPVGLSAPSPGAAPCPAAAIWFRPGSVGSPPAGRPGR
jgi:hypothetical protein